MIRLKCSMDPVDFVDADERFIFQWNASTCELSGHQLDQTGDSVTIRTKLPAVSVIKSIRIKPSRDALALLRSDGNIDLMMLEANLLSQINSSIRARDPDMVEIIDVHWIANDLLLIVSNQGVEFVQVRQKSSAGGSGGIIGSPHCKTVKVVPLTVRWYRYLHIKQLVLCCTSSPSSGTRLQVAQCASDGSSISLWPQCDLNSLTLNSPNETLSRRLKGIGSISLLCLYGNVFCAVANQSDAADVSVTLFIMKDQSFFRTKLIYRIPASSPVNLSIGITDELLVISDCDKRKTCVFDIQQTFSLEPIAPPFSLPSFQLGLTTVGDKSAAAVEMLDIYNSGEWRWETGTDLVFNHSHRALAILEFDPDQHMQTLQSTGVGGEDDTKRRQQLATLLIRRSQSGKILLKMLRTLIIDSLLEPSAVGILFDRMQQRQAKLRDEINEYGRLYTATADEPGSSGGKMLDSIIQALPSRLNLMSSSSAAAPVKSLGRRAVDSCRPLDLPTQHEIYTYILEPLGRHQQQKENEHYPVAIVGEYLRSLAACDLEADPLISELLFHSLVRRAQYRELHNLLQYRVLPDSKRLAELMISIKAEYSPFLQLGMDMLKRLRCHDPILSELLLRDNVMQAVQYARDNAILDKLAPSQFLLAAQMSGDPLIFYNTFRFMEQRNYYLHGTRQFQQNEGCDQFVDYFNRLFPQ